MKDIPGIIRVTRHSKTCEPIKFRSSNLSKSQIIPSVTRDNYSNDREFIHKALLSGHPIEHTCGRERKEPSLKSALIADEMNHNSPDNSYSLSDHEVIPRYQTPDQNKVNYTDPIYNNMTRNDQIKGDELPTYYDYEAQLCEVSKQNVLMNEELDKLKQDLHNIQTENNSIKLINQQLVLKNERNLTYFTNTIEMLQRKIYEVSSKLNSRNLSVVEKEKIIKNLLATLKEIPKKLADVVLKHKSFVLDKNLPDDEIFVCAVERRQPPFLALNNKLLSPRHSMKVICRIKPDHENCLSVPTEQTIYLPKFRHFTKGLGFQLNKILGPKSTQQDVFDEVSPILDSCFDGSNVCVLTYGQSGSGKTHTMLGNDNDPGLILLAMQELQFIAERRESHSHKFYLSILEVYNEIIYDLLNSSEQPKSNATKSRVIIQDNGQSVQIKNVSEAEINDLKDLDYYLMRSQKFRTCSVTTKNANSSRSHYIVMIRISSINNQTHELSNRGVLMLCDLAGSENGNGLSNKERHESRYINRSITMLTSVFDALYKRLPLIPFRDSKLTHLLKPSLIGDAKCIFIATICSQVHNLLDTYRTLNVAKKVEMITFSNRTI